MIARLHERIVVILMSKFKGKKIYIKIIDIGYFTAEKLDNGEMKAQNYNLSNSKRQFLLKNGKGANEMIQPDLIQKLIEQLLAEREKNIKLQLQLEEIKKGKD